MSDNGKISVGDGGFYAVKADGNLVSAKVLKGEMRWATAADVKAKVDAEAKRKAPDSK